MSGRLEGKVACVYALIQPEYVSVNEILIWPTEQDH